MHHKMHHIISHQVKNIICVYLKVTRTRSFTNAKEALALQTKCSKLRCTAFSTLQAQKIQSRMQ